MCFTRAEPERTAAVRFWVLNNRDNERFPPPKVFCLFFIEYDHANYKNSLANSCQFLVRKKIWDSNMEEGGGWLGRG